MLHLLADGTVNPWTSPTGFLVGQGVLGICVLGLAAALRSIYKTSRDDLKDERERHKVEIAAKDALIATKDNEIHALHEKATGEIVPLMTRAIIALERKRS